MIREVEFLYNDYTNPKTLTTLALTLADHHNAFKRFCLPEFFDFVQNFVGHGGALVEAITLNRRVVGSTPALAAI